MMVELYKKDGTMGGSHMKGPTREELWSYHLSEVRVRIRTRGNIDIIF